MKDIVCINDEYFDPYFILGVAHDDDLSHISKAFKTKAKKYHPDKAPKGETTKYERRFRIIIACYEYIKNKRQDLRHDKHNCDVSTSNPKDFSTPNDFGYTTSRYKDADTYKDDTDKYTIVKQFSKFSNKDFNKLFDYTKSKYKTPEQKSLIIHKTTDNFNGYNSTLVENCALVSSYNGLMVVGDTLGQQGIGYWGDTYGDYKMSFDAPKNPSQKVVVPKEFKNKTDKVSDDVKPTVYTARQVKYKKSFKEQAQELYEKTMHSIVQQEELDKNTVLQFACKQYPKDIINDAIAGRLSTSPKLLSTLKQHYNQIEYV